MYVRRKGESKFMSRYKCCTRTDAAAQMRETLRNAKMSDGIYEVCDVMG